MGISQRNLHKEKEEGEEEKTESFPLSKCRIRTNTDAQLKEKKDLVGRCPYAESSRENV